MIGRHTIIGGILGCGIATVGFDGIDWSFESGVSQFFVLWAVAPLLSAFFGAMIFQAIKYSVMKRTKPVAWAVFSLPFLYVLTGAILTSKLLSDHSVLYTWQKLTSF
jgi:sodium-dependent phosphate transporter